MAEFTLPFSSVEASPCFATVRASAPRSGGKKEATPCCPDLQVGASAHWVWSCYFHPFWLLGRSHAWGHSRYPSEGSYAITVPEAPASEILAYIHVRKAGERHHLIQDVRWALVRHSILQGFYNLQVVDMLHVRSLTCCHFRLRAGHHGPSVRLPAAQPQQPPAHHSKFHHFLVHFLAQPLHLPYSIFILKAMCESATVQLCFHLKTNLL